MFCKPFQQLYHDSDYSQDPFLKLHKVSHHGKLQENHNAIIIEQQ
jgi:hypothetical protein